MGDLEGVEEFDLIEGEAYYLLVFDEVASDLIDSKRYLDICLRSIEFLPQSWQAVKLACRAPLCRLINPRFSLHSESFLDHQ